MWKICIALFIVSVLPAESFANKTFANQFIEFSLPDDWECDLQGADWVCQNSENSKKDEAKIVFTAKDEDTSNLEASTFESLLKVYGEIKHIDEPSRSTKIVSKVLIAKRTFIAGQEWADVLQFQSEQKGTFTRYLATTVNGLVILVKFFYWGEKGKEYENVFKPVIESMRAFRRGPDSTIYDPPAPKPSFPHDDWSIFPPGKWVTRIAETVLAIWIALGVYIYSSQRRKQEREA
jgi:hypothetical protein